MHPGGTVRRGIAAPLAFAGGHHRRPAAGAGDGGRRADGGAVEAAVRDEGQQAGDVAARLAGAGRVPQVAAALARVAAALGVRRILRTR